VRSAAGIPAFYASRVPEPCTPAALLVLSAGCKGIVMRPGPLRAAAAKLGKMRTRLTAGEKRNRTATGWPPWSPSTTPGPRDAARTT
jgi:hypothetical protein